MEDAHILAMPMFESKTAAYIFSLCGKLLGTLVPEWRLQILGFSSDGERTMIGRIRGVATKFEEAAENEIVRVWCGLQQSYLVAQAEYRNLYNKNFVHTMTGQIGHLKRQ